MLLEEAGGRRRWRWVVGAGAQEGYGGGLVQKQRCGPGLEPHEQAYGRQLKPEP